MVEREKHCSKNLILLPALILLTSLFPLFSLDDPVGFYLSEDETQWLKKHPVIRVAPDPVFPPIEFFDGNGEFRGMASDYLALLEEILPVRFELIRTESWQESMVLARSRQADMYSAAVITEPRTEYMSFSPPYLEFEAVILVNNGDSRIKTLSLDDLKGRDVLIPSGYYIHEILEEQYPDINLIPKSNLSECLRALALGEAYAFIGNISTISYHLEEQGITNLRLAGKTGMKLRLSLAVRSDWPEFLIILNKAMEQISEEEKSTIYSRWIHIEDSALKLSRRRLKILSFTLLSILLILILILLWNRSLKAGIARKTEQLEGEMVIRKASEESLRISEIRFRTLVNNLPGVIYRKGEASHNEMDFISDYIEKLSGYPAEDFMGTHPARTLSTLLPPEELIRVAPDLEYAVKNRKPFHLNYRIRHADGSLRHVQEHGQFLIDRENGKPYMDGVILDETELKRYEEAMVQAEKMETVGRMSSGIVHDFNNVLTGMTSVVNLMELDLKEDEEIGREKLTNYISMLKLSGDRAAGIVKGLLSLSRTKEITFRMIDLNDVIRNVVMICSPNLDRSVRIESTCPDEPSMTKGDALRLEQVVLNLCINAEHAMTIMEKEDKKGGIVELTLESCRRESPLVPSSDTVEYWRISVGDTGVGIDEDRLENIFTPFFTTKEGETGTGLGLSTSYNTVRSHSGFIEVHSAPGEGSRFEVYLPVIREA